MGFLQCFAIIERSEMGLYDMPMFMSLFGYCSLLYVVNNQTYS